MIQTKFPIIKCSKCQQLYNLDLHAHQANIINQDDFGNDETDLMWACWLGDLKKIIRQLFEENSNANFCSIHDESACTYVDTNRLSIENRIATYWLLSMAGMDIELLNRALIEAMKSKQFMVVYFLVKIVKTKWNNYFFNDEDKNEDEVDKNDKNNKQNAKSINDLNFLILQYKESKNQNKSQWQIDINQIQEKLIKLKKCSS